MNKTNSTTQTGLMVASELLDALLQTANAALTKPEENPDAAIEVRLKRDGFGANKTLTLEFDCSDRGTMPDRLVDEICKKCGIVS